MLARNIVECNESSLELQCARALVPGKPVSRYTEVRTKILVGPEISGKADSSSSFGKVDFERGEVPLPGLDDSGVYLGTVGDIGVTEI